MADLRSATAEDLPTVVDFWDREGGPTHSPGGLAEATRLLERDPEALVVAVEEGRIVGTLIVGWDGWRCHMYRLAVEPAYRRRGIARALIDEAQRRAIDHGARRIDATVHLENGGAIAAWESAGFAVEPESGRFLLFL